VGSVCEVTGRVTACHVTLSVGGSRVGRVCGMVVVTSRLYGMRKMVVKFVFPLIFWGITIFTIIFSFRRANAGIIQGALVGLLCGIIILGLHNWNSRNTSAYIPKTLSSLRIFLMVVVIAMPVLFSFGERYENLALGVLCGYLPIYSFWQTIDSWKWREVDI